MDSEGALEFATARDVQNYTELASFNCRRRKNFATIIGNWSSRNYARSPTVFSKNEAIIRREWRRANGIAPNGKKPWEA